jgi:hypothetical protein
VAQQTLTYLSTGSASRGMGTGHTAIEPAILSRYRFNDCTYLFSEVRYWIPIGGTAEHVGGVLRWNFGASTIWLETDAFAALPTLEILGTSFLDGQETLPDGTVQNIDGATGVEVLPGMRWVLGPKGDLGLFELAVAGGPQFGDPGWVDSRLKVELRWSF